MAKAKLYTVGYEGLRIDEFVEFLRKKGIRTLADVRKNPLSRKPGFSKTRLAAALAEQGIRYVHYPGLGVPSEWRRQSRQGSLDRREMFRRYERQILPEHRDELKQVQDGTRTPGFAILCYEADAADCHRSSVARELMKRGAVEVVDLHVGDSAESERQRPRSSSLAKRGGRVPPTADSGRKKRASLSSSKPAPRSKGRRAGTTTDLN